MNTTFRFDSAQWECQIAEVRQRDEMMTNYSDCFLDCDATLDKLDKALAENPVRDLSSVDKVAHTQSHSVRNVTKKL